MTAACCGMPREGSGMRRHGGGMPDKACRERWHDGGDMPEAAKAGDMAVVWRGMPGEGSGMVRIRQYDSAWRRRRGEGCRCRWHATVWRRHGLACQGRAAAWFKAGSMTRHGAGEVLNLKSELFDVVSIIIILCVARRIYERRSSINSAKPLMRLYLCHVTPESSHSNC